MDDQNSDKRLLTVKETADLLRISPRTIYNQIGPGAQRPFPIRPRRVGRLVRFAASDIQRYLNSI
ncbi:MAG: helix-turn-helix domain-containing protein [Thermodesulfobacteriota bacterium]|nr:helix-turn-helix domain-containing protein [Thermodesulfobacteriota bacterium]